MSTTQKSEPGWNFTEPPKDRPIVMIGGVFVQDEHGAFKDHFVDQVHYCPEHKTWLGTDGLSVRRYANGELQCYAWTELPDYDMNDALGIKPITLEWPLGANPDAVPATDDTVNAEVA